jgi:hypothetical protein
VLHSSCELQFACLLITWLLLLLDLQVYGELIGALESPIENLLAFEGTAEDLLATFDAAAGSDLASVLDFKAAQPEAPQSSS